MKITSTAKTSYEKNIIWDKIKAIGGQNPTDTKAAIKIADNSVYQYYTLKSGESLGKIAKHYYDDSHKYKDIYEADTNYFKKSGPNPSKSVAGNSKSVSLNPSEFIIINFRGFLFYIHLPMKVPI